MSRRSAAEVSVGEQLPALTVRLTRADLVRYAGASLDFNPIHWNEALAKQVGLPDVLAHGMLTMALGGRLLTDWAGDPAAVRSYGVRFTRPVVVPNDEAGAEVELTGKVTELTEDGVAKVTVTAKFDGKTVLGKAIGHLQLG